MEAEAPIMCIRAVADVAVADVAVVGKAKTMEYSADDEDKCPCTQKS